MIIQILRQNCNNLLWVDSSAACAAMGTPLQFFTFRVLRIACGCGVGIENDLGARWRQPPRVDWEWQRTKNVATA